jgi:hypothetical protein
LKLLNGPFVDALVEAVLQNLCVVDEEENDNNGISESAASCL